MYYKKITKLAMGLLLTVGVSSSLMADLFSDKQQKELKSARAICTQKNIPAGMQSGDLRATTERDSGAELVDSVLVLDHTAVFPLPTLAGRIASASLDSDGLRLVFADNQAAKFKAPPVASDSYILAQSGDLRLFDIVVNNDTVQVVAEDTSKPLRFSLYDYRKQVAAGSLMMAKNGDIVATVPSSDGPDNKAAAYTGEFSSPSTPASTEPAAGCINRAGFNTCEEKVVERKVIPRSDKKTSSVSKASAKICESFLSTEGKMKLKDVKAGTCFNRAGFVIDCQ